MSVIRQTHSTLLWCICISKGEAGPGHGDAKRPRSDRPSLISGVLCACMTHRCFLLCIGYTSGGVLNIGHSKRWRIWKAVFDLVVVSYHQPGRAISSTLKKAYSLLHVNLTPRVGLQMMREGVHLNIHTPHWPTLARHSPNPELTQILTNRSNKWKRMAKAIHGMEMLIDWVHYPD